MYCFRHANGGALAEVLPQGYLEWSAGVLEILKDSAPLSPTILRDCQIAEVLCRGLQEA